MTSRVLRLVDPITGEVHAGTCPSCHRLQTELDMANREIKAGFCQCGCGERTKLAPWTGYSGLQKDEPLRYVVGHNARKSPVDYIVDQDTGCWVWQLCKNPEGYGRINRREWGAPRPAHRVYYERFKGPIPTGLELDHLCRNPACVNPDHLEPVTAAQNVQRGRATKLTVDEVRTIRHAASRRRYGLATELARRYGITTRQIHTIWSGKAWRDVQ